MGRKMAGLLSYKRVVPEYWRVCACFWLIASSATGQGGSGACGVPAAPPGLFGQFPDAITFSYQMPGLAGTCTPDITVKEEDRPNALYRIWEYYPCTGQVKEIITDP